MQELPELCFLLALGGKRGGRGRGERDSWAVGWVYREKTGEPRGAIVNLAGWEALIFWMVLNVDPAPAWSTSRRGIGVGVGRDELDRQVEVAPGLPGTRPLAASQRYGQVPTGSVMP